MAAIAALRATGNQSSSNQLWVRQEAVLGRQLGDDHYRVHVWAEGEDVELGIQDSLVSRRHARLFFEGDCLLLQDLGSANGTFLNDQRIEAGSPGPPSELPIGLSRIGIGPRCLVDVELVPSPLGMQARDWGRLSGRLSYPDLNTVCDLWRWGERVRNGPDDAILWSELAKWYQDKQQETGQQRFFDQFLDVLKPQMERMSEDYRLALNALENQLIQFSDSAVEITRTIVDAQRKGGEEQRGRE